MKIKNVISTRTLNRSSPKERLNQKEVVGATIKSVSNKLLKFCGMQTGVATPASKCAARLSPAVPTSNTSHPKPSPHYIYRRNKGLAPGD